MARPLRIELSGGVYHVIARGNEQKDVFRDDRDRKVYLDRLAECRSRFSFRVLAYCLMSNHVHLALERGPVSLSRIMLALQSFYAQSFNLRHRRVGHLFQGRYKAFLVQDDCYLFALLRYIHFNPVAAALVDRPELYRWSSDRFYRARSAPEWLDTDRVLGMLASERGRAIAAYRRLMAKREDQTYEDVPAYGTVVKGEPEFASHALAFVGEAPKRASDWTPEQIATFVATAEGFSLEQLRTPRRSARNSRARLIAAYLGRHVAGISAARMAKCFAREESTFNRGIQRLEMLMNRDPTVYRRVAELIAILGSRNTGIHD